MDRKQKEKIRKKARSKRDEVFSLYGTRCFYCKVRDADTIDHLVPISKGGKSDVSNLRPACFICNKMKGDNIIETG